MKRLILAGGGHAHLSVLRALTLNRPANLEVLLITPNTHQIYSGMVPGWVAGHYTQAQCQIDLRPLARAAHVHMVTERIAGMDADQRCVRLSDGRLIQYDLLSLDVGSEADMSWLEVVNENTLPVKPLETFFELWPRIMAAARQLPDYQLVVVGGGPAAIELVLAAQYAFAHENLDVRVLLVASQNNVLTGHAAGVKRRVLRYLAHVGVKVYLLDAVGADQEGVVLSDGSVLRADSVISATGARAPAWLASSQLMLDEDGYIAVNAHHRSLSHRAVFAAGDVCARQDVLMARSGVHAVHAGPVLARNLLAALAGRSLARYRPRRYSLYLLATGAQYAIASWGGLSMEGNWVWRWKNRIDQGFIQRFSDIA